MPLDGMDNAKSNLPRFKEKSKKLSNFYKLPSKITGAIIFSSKYPLNRKVKMFVNFDQGGLQNIVPLESGFC